MKAQLTAKEHIALMALVKDGMNCNGSEEPRELLEDNMTWFNRKSLSAATGFSKHEAAGLMSSLEVKGMVTNEDDPGQEYACFVTDDGINYAQEHFNK